MSENEDNAGTWLRDRCYACGHQLAFAASGCPQCGETFDGRDDPDEFPDVCRCNRCEGA